MNAVWMVRERQIATRLRFWTAIVGYDPRDHSISHRLYLIYVIIFFSIWGFAVLALLADLGAGILSLSNMVSPAQAAISLTSILIIGDFLLRMYRCSRRSPFVFSEEDAGLICQTPVDRRQVAIAWMLGDWFPGMLLYLAFGVVLSFANIQLTEGISLQWNRLFIYLIFGMRVASIIFLANFALVAFDYAIGSIRLRGDRDIPGVRIFSVGIAAVLITLFMLNKQMLRVLLWPVIFPISSGFGVGSWLFGFFVASMLVVMSIFVLYIASSRLNLSRAAQESRFRWSYQQVSWLGDAYLNRQMKAREKLGTGHAISSIPGKAGIWALIWKDWVISLRVLNVAQVLEWLGIFGASMGILFTLSWGVQLWSLVLWVTLISQRCTERLRNDLELWVISRQLPFSSKKTIIPEVIQPMLGAISLSWLAYGLNRLLGITSYGLFFWLIPGLVISITFLATIDILRHTRGSELIAGRVMGVGASGLIFGVIFSGLMFILSTWIKGPFGENGIYWLLGLIGFSFSYGMPYLLWRLTVTLYRDIK